MKKKEKATVEKKKEPLSVRCWMYTCNRDKLPKDFLSKEKLEERLNQTGELWAYIAHTKDTYTAEDQLKDPKHKAGTPKEDHLHITIYLRSAKTATAMAAALGKDVRPEQLEKFTGRNAKANAFAYLIHATDSARNKYQYRAEDVHANFPYTSYIKGMQNSLDEEMELSKETVIQGIMDGEFRMIDFMMDDKLTMFYVKHKDIVTHAIDANYKRLQNDRKRPPVMVLYIEGEQGSGKTAYAKHFALSNYRDYCMSSSKNDSTQDYLGQDVMIFDDARPGDFDASDWLKLLDPFNNEGSVASRYYNKYLNVKCIIMTSVVPFEEFFVYAKNKASGSGLKEPIGQFMRRFTAVLKVKREEVGDVIFADVDIYGVQSCDPFVKRVGDPGIVVEYVHKLEPTPKKSVQLRVGEKNKSRLTEDMLDKF